MKEPHSGGVANHADLESCAGGGDTAGEALTEALVGRLSSRETLISGRRPCGQKGKATSFVALSRVTDEPGAVVGTPARQETPRTRTGRPRRRLPRRVGRWEKAQAVRPRRTSWRSRSGVWYRGRIRTKTGNRRRRVRREDPAPSRTSDSRARSAPSSGPPDLRGGRRATVVPTATRVPVPRDSGPPSTLAWPISASLTNRNPLSTLERLARPSVARNLPLRNPAPPRRSPAAE